MHPSFPIVQSLLRAPSCLNLSAIALFLFLFYPHSSLFFLTPVLILPPLSLPNSPSVQRWGTRSRHWLDFHTVPSTERHIKLIRVNNCGSALLSRAPTGLAWPGSGDTDGLVISVLGAEGTDEGGCGWPGGCGCWLVVKGAQLKQR